MENKIKNKLFSVLINKIVAKKVDLQSVEPGATLDLTPSDILDYEEIEKVYYEFFNLPRDFFNESFKVILKYNLLHSIVTGSNKKSNYIWHTDIASIKKEFTENPHVGLDFMQTFYKYFVFRQELDPLFNKIINENTNVKSYIENLFPYEGEFNFFITGGLRRLMCDIYSQYILEGYKHKCIIDTLEYVLKGGVEESEISLEYFKSDKDFRSYIPLICSLLYADTFEVLASQKEISEEEQQVINQIKEIIHSNKQFELPQDKKLFDTIMQIFIYFNLEREDHKKNIIELENNGEIKTLKKANKFYQFDDLY